MSSLPNFLAFFTFACLPVLAVETPTTPEKSETTEMKDVPGGHPPIIIEKPAKEEKATAESVQKLLKKLSPTDYDLNGLKIDLKAQELRVPAVTKIIKGPLEYLLTKDTGAAHEALFTTKNNPFEVHVALLLMGFKPSETYFKRETLESYPAAVKSPKIEPTSEFIIVVQHLVDGQQKEVPVENWVKNLRTGTSLVHGPWVLTGSFFTADGDLAAMGSGNIISLYQDPVALANNPRQDNELDDNWEAMPGLPAEDSPVTLVFRKKASPAVTK